METLFQIVSAADINYPFAMYHQMLSQWLWIILNDFCRNGFVATLHSVRAQGEHPGGKKSIMMFAGAIRRDCVGIRFVSFSAFDFRVVDFSAFGPCLQARMQLRSSTCSMTARSSRSMALMRAPWCSRAPSASECGGCGLQWLPRLQWGPMVRLALLATGRPVRSLLEEAAD